MRQSGKLTMTGQLDGRYALIKRQSASLFQDIASARGPVMLTEGRASNIIPVPPRLRRYLGACCGSDREPPPRTQRGYGGQQALSLKAPWPIQWWGPPGMNRYNLLRSVLR